MESEDDIANEKDNFPNCLYSKHRTGDLDHFEADPHIKNKADPDAEASFFWENCCTYPVLDQKSRALHCPVVTKKSAN